MIRRPPESTRPYTLFPYTTLFRSRRWGIFFKLATLAIVAYVLWLGLGADVSELEATGPHTALIRIDGTIEAKGAGDADNVISALTKRSEEHTSELKSLMRISYAVFCCKKKKN